MTGTAQVLILSHCGGEPLYDCLESVRREQPDCPVPVTVTLLDALLPNEDAAKVKKHYADVTVLALDGNPGFSCAFNRGAQAATGDYLVILNDDTVLRPGALRGLLEPLLADRGLFAVGAVLVGDLGLQVGAARGSFTCGRLAITQREPATMVPTLYGSGAACAFRRDTLLKLGGFDELLFYWEDVELGLRAWRHGYRSVVNPAARVYHRLEMTYRTLYSETTMRCRQAESHYLTIWKHAAGWLLLKHLVWLPLQLIAAPLTGRPYVWRAYREARKKHDRSQLYRAERSLAEVLGNRE